MDRSGKQAVQQEKRSRKSNSSSRRTKDVPATGPGLAAPGVVAAAAGGQIGTPAAGPGVVVPGVAVAAGTAAPTSSFPPAAWWRSAPLGTFTADSSRSSSEWLCPPSSIMNCLQRSQISPPFPQPHPFVNYPNASHLPENFHFVGASSSSGTPSPTGCGLAKDGAQVGSQDKETIDIDDDDTLEPARSDKRLNWSHEEDIRLFPATLEQDGVNEGPGGAGEAAREAKGGAARTLTALDAGEVC